MEDELDAVSRGEEPWVTPLQKFWKPFIDQVEEIEAINHPARLVVAAFLARTPGARDLTPELTAGWPSRPPGAGPGYQVLPGETGMDGFYYACLSKPL